MSKTYKATGINLKAQPLGESDKIVTILTQEFGLIRAVATGARKQNSSLGGRMGMFIVNELLISQGRNLDRITQAETIKTYPGLSKDLGKLAASQYLAEIVLCQALSELPQTELYELFNEHLQRLNDIPKTEIKCVVAHLVQGVFQLLALAGLTPQVESCCLTQRLLTPDWTNPHWQVGFSIPSGGIICLDAWKSLRTEIEQENRENREMQETTQKSVPNPQSCASNPSYETVFHQQELPIISRRLNGKQLVMLQYLSETEIIQIDAASDSGWLAVEQILRQYVQYHLGQPIRSATLIDSYFATNHDAIV
ncbi:MULTISPECIES: DNA repair protein RecO [Nostocales]|jgi:DNA repair protein RecO (recombination protein O)|uniref:DNA repair protein RecO n=1 Tax=Nostocales TaxID=1161 RepID=UPI00029B6732|nr:MULTISPECIES: DNA repair protein RecO [Nostocales]MBO1052772.1 DNA repair protein RecO [Dolichospermum sp. DET73]AFW94075.1 DNA repair protein RecO [Anabaena sp. 90]MTJ19644.1 DNA repair protein RecO [Dolichospermum sp. UHCC 0299]MTJ22613.1 DNA repair protein RecO [Dolichospermum sp. UHCC 0352]MTJ39010.1 DNA repair protein RecO [Dolichospermum sp. UHCC 0406]